MTPRRKGWVPSDARLSFACLIPLLVLLIADPTAMQSSKQVITQGVFNFPFSAAVRVGDLIYLSGTMATDAQGKIVSGGIKDQTKQTIDNLAAVLKESGSSLENVASVMVYLHDASDFAAMNEVYRTYWPARPPVRTTVQANLVLPGGLVEMSMVAIRNGAERKVIHPSDWMASPNPYSYGIQSGNTLFLAGLVARNGRDNSVVEGDVAAQTRTVLDNGTQILKAAGMTLADVVSARVFLTDAATFQDMNGVYRTLFPTAPPARATVRAALMGPQFRVEITMVAVKDPARRAVTTPGPDGKPGTPNPVLSSAIQVGNRLYLSGMLGNTDATKGDTRAQTQEALARLGRTLEAAGFNWSHVVDGIVYITDVKNFAAMNEGYRTVFTKDFPARATVEVGLMGQDGLVEIMLTAAK